MKSLPVVTLIATGGTIAMKIDPVKQAPVPASTGDDLVSIVPEIAAIAKIEVLNISNIPSAYMDADRWIGLQKVVTEVLARSEVAGVIVSHGTDTLEETAYFLDLTVRSELGEGSTFTLSLPLANPEPEPAARPAVVSVASAN